MTTLSKHQPGTGQGVEFQSIQSQYEELQEKYKRHGHECNKKMHTCAHTQSHESTHTHTPLCGI